MLPAASAHAPPTTADPASGPSYDFAASQLTPPLVASVPANATDSAWLYQPFASATRDGDAVTAGAVASYLNPNEREPRLPAASMQSPETDALAVSGPSYDFAASQVTPSLVASAPANATESAWLYQSFASASRDGEVGNTGRVASYLNPNEPEPRLPAASTHSPETDALRVSGPS